MSESAFDTEIGMLREFYRSWVALHTIPKDKLHRRKQEAAAQLLVDNAHVLRLFYGGTNRQPKTPKLEVVSG